jgi:hypothetical protein
MRQFGRACSARDDRDGLFLCDKPTIVASSAACVPHAGDRYSHPHGSEQAQSRRHPRRFLQLARALRRCAGAFGGDLYFWHANRLSVVVAKWLG